MAPTDAATFGTGPSVVAPTYTGRAVRVFLAIVVAMLAAAPAASADEEIQAGPPARFTTPNPTMDQGEPLFFRNLDVQDHDVTARATGPDGRPLFGTPLIGQGERQFVEGSQYLTTGRYDFFCSIHPNMTGTLTVTSAGTPATRRAPGAPAPADNAAPSVRLKVRSGRLGRVRRSRKLQVEVTVNEAAKVALRAVARVGGRNVTIARGEVELPGAGTRRENLRLTRAGRRALRGRSRLAASVRARAVDRAGNAGATTVRSRLR